MHTYKDAVEHLIDYLGGTPSDSSVRDAKRAAQASIRQITNSHGWSYLLTVGRVTTSVPYSTGTVSYDDTGGAYERQLTLSGGTWPDWAAQGYVRIGEVNFKVEERKSATILTLDSVASPESDISSTGFILYRDSYLLPADYVSQDEPYYESNFGGMSYVRPTEWLFANSRIANSGDPICFTVTGDSDFPGRLLIRFSPWPDASRTIEFVYRRRPRPLSLFEASDGTVSITSGSSMLTGSSTSFTPSMVGSVLRISSNRDLPTSEIGSNPATFETTILSYLSPSSLTLAETPTQSFSGSKYVISDPVDIEIGSMLELFHRGCEWQISINRTLKDKPSANNAYLRALGSAKSADSRSFQGRSSYNSEAFPGKRPLWSQPSGPLD